MPELKGLKEIIFKKGKISLPWQCISVYEYPKMLRHGVIKLCA